MITELARQALKEYVGTKFLRWTLGTGGDSANPNSTNLDAPIYNTVDAASTGSLTVSTSGVSSVDFTISLNASSYVGEVIREVGIFNSESIIIGGTTYAAGSIMLIRVPFDGIGPITSSDTIEIVVSVDVV